MRAYLALYSSTYPPWSRVICRSARAGPVARHERNSRDNSVMRMGRSITGSLSGRQNRSLSGPDGATLAGLCWNFVKHAGGTKNTCTVTNFSQFSGIFPLDGSRNWPKMLAFSSGGPDDQTEARL